MNSAGLHEVSLLCELTDEELRIFAGLLKFHVAHEGERIVEKGEKIDAFYIVSKGAVIVRRKAQHEEVLLGRIGKGGYFGEMNLFGPGIATASVYARSDVTLASIAYESFRRFISENPKAGCKIMSSILSETSNRLFQANERYVAAIFWRSMDETPQES